MTQGVTFPIKFVNEGNGIEVATRDMTKLEESVAKINAKFKEFGEKASQEWQQFTVAVSAVNQIVGTLNDHIQKAADSFNSFDTSMRAANTMAGLGEEELKRFAFTAKPTHEPLALLAILVACFPETFYNCWCKYQKNQTIYN